MKVIEKSWGYHNRTLVLTAIVDRQELVGFDCHGMKKYQSKLQKLVYYGVTKAECNHRLRIDLNGMDTLRKGRKVASLYEITAISVQYI